MHYAVGGFKFAKYKTWFNQTFMLAYDDFSTSTYLIVYKDVPTTVLTNMELINTYEDQRFCPTKFTF